MCKYRIALDGGAGTGKSTVSNILSKKLGITYINTGLTYRLIAMIAMDNNLLGRWEELLSLIKSKKIDYNGAEIIMNEEFDIKRLKSPDVGANASIMASQPIIWEFASNLWKKISKRTGVLLEGRDIGTQIMPLTKNKFFMIVSDEEAAKRRVKEHKLRGEEISYEEILSSIKTRNKRDSERNIAPLKVAEDAIIIDTSSKTPQEVVDFIVSKIE